MLRFFRERFLFPACLEFDDLLRLPPFSIPQRASVPDSQRHVFRLQFVSYFSLPSLSQVWFAVATRRPRPAAAATLFPAFLLQTFCRASTEAKPTPNHALQRTRAAVTPAASGLPPSPPATQRSRQPRGSLSLRSLGVTAHVPFARRFFEAVLRPMSYPEFHLVTFRSWRAFTVRAAASLPCSS